MITTYRSVLAALQEKTGEKNRSASVFLVPVFLINKIRPVEISTGLIDYDWLGYQLRISI
jgi:hypothetical protein